MSATLPQEWGRSARNSGPSAQHGAKESFINEKNIAIRCMPLLLVLPMQTGANAQTAGLETSPAIAPPSSVSMTNAIYKGKAALHLTDLNPRWRNHGDSSGNR